MLITSRLAASICALTLALTACSGTTTTPPGPPRTTLSIATQRNAAQAALAAEFGVGILTLIFGQGTTQSFTGSGIVSSPPVCSNGVEISVVSMPSTVTTTIDVFYDPVCTKILSHTVLVQTLTSPGNASLSGTATFTSQAGAVVAYTTLSGTVTKSGGTTSFSVTGTAAPSQSAPATASFGLSCSATGTANTCGFGGIQNVSLLNTEFGNTFTFNGTQSGSTNTGAATLKAYLSGLNAMTLSAGPGSTAWTITGGGNPVINDSGTFTVTIGPFNLATAIGVSLSDQTADASATANMSAGPFGNTSGTVTQISNGAVATFYGLDGTGTGTILYSDGTTAPVQGFIVL
jgi:hypothetical protein